MIQAVGEFKIKDTDFKYNDNLNEVYIIFNLIKY